MPFCLRKLKHGRGEFWFHKTELVRSRRRNALPSNQRGTAGVRKEAAVRELSKTSLLANMDSSNFPARDESMVFLRDRAVSEVRANAWLMQPPAGTREREFRDSQLERQTILAAAVSEASTVGAIEAPEGRSCLAQLQDAA